MDNSRTVKILAIVEEDLLFDALSSGLLPGKNIRMVHSPLGPRLAWNAILTESPDLIILDGEMVNRCGFLFLRMLVVRTSCPVILLLPPPDRKNYSDLLKGIKEFDVITVPGSSVKSSAGKVVDTVQSEITKIRKNLLSCPARGKTVADGGMVIAIGASTGGPEALRILLQKIPANSPPILIVQHMPEKFIGPFAARLNANCSLSVKVASGGEYLAPGCVFIGPAGKQLRLHKDSADYSVYLSSRDTESFHKPSVDVLFSSVAEVAGEKSIGVILTGMGADGSVGMRQMYDAGAHTIAQDKTSCAVFGMPKEAIAKGGVKAVMSLDKIAAAIAMVAEQKGR